MYHNTLILCREFLCVINDHKRDVTISPVEAQFYLDPYPIGLDPVLI